MSSENSGAQGAVRLIAIGASAGGTEALGGILQHLPADFPCVAVVQHMLPGFTQMFCARMDTKCSMRASVARDGDPVEKGRIYFAGDEGQLRIRMNAAGEPVLHVGGCEKIGGHCPSADALFGSAAECLAERAVGVILTGMGCDGAEGLLQMRRAGAYTIGQDEQSSAVYGMPKAAYQMGAVVRQFPLSEISGALIRLAAAAPKDR